MLKMKPKNMQTIQSVFTQQSGQFENHNMNFTNQDYLADTVSRIAPCAADHVLEVAAGTCACGRALAPMVKTVVCLDLTPAMLEVGRREAQKLKLENITFLRGCAEELPFLDHSFDMVLSRLAFHHFAEVTEPFKEMARVLKPGGKLVLIDMEAAEEHLRAAEDEIETLRDPSHVRNLSREEMIGLFRKNGLTVTLSESTPIPVSLMAWMELTKTPEQVRKEIVRRMQAELDGGQQTGFAPYQTESGIFFRQRWLLTMGIKPNAEA